jgi:3-methyladenine DNA glycosylase AlkD
MKGKIFKEIYSYKDKNRAKSSIWYFKTGKSEYGEGDKFLGLTMGQQRKIAKSFLGIDFDDVKILLNSVYHEERMIGLLILVYKYKNAEGKLKKKIFDFYIKNKKMVNNWDLVDVTTPNIIGDYLKDKDKKLLYIFSKSKNIWEKRMSILATFPFIKDGKFEDSFKISKILLFDEHDLIHKAVGWMLREVGKKNIKELRKFLDLNKSKMPRTMLRYSIERFPENLRLKYLRK